MSHVEREILANIVKYATEKFDYYKILDSTASLDRESYLKIAKLTAIIRLSEGLDLSHRGKCSKLKIVNEEDELLLTIETNADMTLEFGLFNRYATSFEEVYNIKPVIRQKKVIFKGRIEMGDKNSKTDYSKSEYYYNRELSWLAFNNRVLGEAKDRDIPLFERIKFLGITASNLDEFFMVRVASLKDMVNAGYTKKDIAGMTPNEQLEVINKATHELVNMQYAVYNRSLLPQLAQNGLMVVESHEELTKKDCAFVDRYFQDNVYPVLTPMAVDSSRPFPLIRNKSLNLGALVSRKEVKGRRHLFNKKSVHGKEVEFATVQVPSVLPRIVQLPEASDGTKRVILLEQIIERNMDKLFLNYNIECSFPFRIMRNADFSLEEEETEDLLKEIEKQLKKRQWGEAIRLEVEEGIETRLLDIIKKELMIDERDIYNIEGPLDLTFLMKMYGLEGFAHLKNRPYIPQPVPEIETEEDIFEKIREQDILLHHPYQTFAPVVDFIKQAAKDPQVLAIKQTLYRVSGNSPIIAALAQAAENGKQVSVLVELKARFDEENNIVWAKKLENGRAVIVI